jgi:NADH-ubiquinone oxidoreductase chain 4
VFLVKLPVYGVHLWLPKAHVEAPVSGSILLAGVLLKLGAYGFFRFSLFLLIHLRWGGYLFSFGIIGGFFRCFLCLRQVDLKSFIAYSSVCHIGFGLAGIYSLSFFGYSGGLYIIIAHGFCSSCLFYILYVFYKRYHTRSLFLLKGALVFVPIMAFFWFLFSALNIGIPPSFPFFSEIFIIRGVLSLNLFTFFLCGGFLLLAGVYCIYVYTVTFHGQAVFEGLSFKVRVREYLNMYGHLFPLFFIPLNSSFFFFWLTSLSRIIDCGSLG